jgi:repressor LexA
MNNYSSLLSNLIDKTGLSLTDIVLRAEKHGQKITTSYLSKLKNGKMPPPSFKISIALALSLEIEPQLLLSAGIKDNTEVNKEELKKALQELYPEMDDKDVVKTASKIIKSPEKVAFTEAEQNVIQERDLSLEALKDKYNLEIDGKPATEEEIEEMIKYIKFYRIKKEMESS